MNMMTDMMRFSSFFSAVSLTNVILGGFVGLFFSFFIFLLKAVRRASFFFFTVPSAPSQLLIKV